MMPFIDFQTQLEKLRASDERKIKRLQKRLELQKGKPKPLSIMKLKKDLRTVTHKIVRLTYDNCYSCDKFVPLKERQAGHYHTDKGNPGVRYDFDNLRTQCGGCNYRVGGDAHYGARLLSEIGQERIEQLNKNRKMNWGWKAHNYELLIEIRKQQLKDLECKESIDKV